MGCLGGWRENAKHAARRPKLIRESSKYLQDTNIKKIEKKALRIALAHFDIHSSITQPSNAEGPTSQGGWKRAEAFTC